MIQINSFTIDYDHSTANWIKPLLSYLPSGKTEL